MNRKLDYQEVRNTGCHLAATYAALIANAGDLADYVSGGGILLAHACDIGWNVGHWSSSWIPGGVGHVHSLQQLLSIVDGTSPYIVSSTQKAAFSL